jgi:hypothetical protein
MTGWTESPVGSDNARVTNFIRFSADDYRALAMAARASAYQAEKDAEGQSNPKVREAFLRQRARYSELAEKCENAARVL